MGPARLILFVVVIIKTAADSVWPVRDAVRLVSEELAMSLDFDDLLAQDVHHHLEKREASEARARATGMTSCGDGMCRCTLTHANCTHNAGILNYIPRLPDGITHLNFSYNGVQFIEHAEFFLNATGVISLDLGHNGLSRIGTDAFALMENLTELALGFNRLDYANLVPVFALRRLKFLNIFGNDLEPLPDGIFHRYPLPSLQELYLGKNRMNSFNMTNLTPLVSLSFLDISFNQIPGAFLTMDYLPSLQALMLTVNAIDRFPTTCRNGTSLLPNLIVLALAHNVLLDITGEVCLPNLQVLSLSSNLIQTIFTDMFRPERFPKLLGVDLATMQTPVIVIQPYAFRHPLLLSVVIRDSEIDFNSPLISPDSFRGCVRLESLDAGQNDFSQVTNEKYHRLFANFTNFKQLILRSADLDRVSTDMFPQHAVNVVLDNNKISHLPDGVFDSLKDLKLVSLLKNRITSVRETTFSPTLRHQLKLLDLRENPFTCSCELRWFREWLVSQPAKFHARNGQRSYVCDNLPQTLVQSFYLADQACLLSQETSIFTITCIVLIKVSFLMMTLLFRYRWHLRLVLYEAFRGKGERQIRLQQEHFDYDIFVSYPKENFDFVRMQLMPELEEGMGLRLCIHERDFIPGKNIVDNISDCVQSSKKVMMLFSTSFARSEWCQFELNFCLRHVMDHDDVLLVLLLHDIPSRDLTTAMMAVMKTTTYIEWAEEAEAKKSFWRRIYIALDEILPDA